MSLAIVWERLIQHALFQRECWHNGLRISLNNPEHPKYECAVQMDGKVLIVEAAPDGHGYHFAWKVEPTREEVTKLLLCL